MKTERKYLKDESKQNITVCCVPGEWFTQRCTVGDTFKSYLSS